MKFLVTGGSGFIGTNLIELLSYKYPEAAILNLDILPPRDPKQSCFYHFCDINLYWPLEAVFLSFSPTYVFHLAAATGVGNLDLDSFSTNVQGVQNVINASYKCCYLTRIVFASSLLVCRVGYVPDSYEEYCPTTNYGISKMKGEILVKNSSRSLPWVIVRPISIWGPWNAEPYTQFFRAVLSGFYFHIGRCKSFRSLGYVGNTVYQLDCLAFADALMVCHNLFYLADYDPASLRKMANSISMRRLNFIHFIPTLPIWLVRIFARIGDFFQYLTGKPMRLNTFRLTNLTTEYVFDLSALREVCGALPFSVAKGVDDTISWIRNTPKD